MSENPLPAAPPDFDPAAAPGGPFANLPPDPAELAAIAEAEKKLAGTAGAPPNPELVDLRRQLEELKGTAEDTDRYIDTVSRKYAAEPVRPPEPAAAPPAEVPMPDPLLKPAEYQAWLDQRVARGVAAAMPKPTISPYTEDPNAIISRTWGNLQKDHKDEAGKPEWMIRQAALEVNTNLKNRKVDPIRLMQDDPKGYNKLIAANVRAKAKEVGMAEGSNGDNNEPRRPAPKPRTAGLPDGEPGAPRRPTAREAAVKPGLSDGLSAKRRTMGLI